MANGLSAPFIRPSGPYSHEGRRRGGTISRMGFSPCERGWRAAPDEGYLSNSSRKAP